MASQVRAKRSMVIGFYGTAKGQGRYKRGENLSCVTTVIH